MCRGGDAGLWFMTTGFEDYNGENWPHKVAHVGYRVNGLGEVFPQGDMELSLRMEAPSVTVDNLQTFRYATFYDNPNRSDMNAVGRVDHEVNSLIGVTANRTVRQYSNEYHDGYHIIEWEYTNTGEVNGELDPPEQTLENVYFVHIRQNEPTKHGVIGNGAGWGRQTMNDRLGDDLVDYDIEHELMYSWTGSEPGFPWNTIGMPLFTDDSWQVHERDTVGRLSDAFFTGMATLHADRGPNDDSDWLEQPGFTGFIDNNGPRTVTNPDNRGYMSAEYELVSGNDLPSHADNVVGAPSTTPEPTEEWIQRMATQDGDPAITTGGFIQIYAYGPYTLEPGESVNIVQARAFAGLSEEATLEIGKAYKQLTREGNPDGIIEYDANGDGQITHGTNGPDESRTKNEWVMTARDSLLQLVERAQAAYDNGYEVPAAPKPPQEFHVTSGPDQISIEWTPYSDADNIGWELYRAEDNAEGKPQAGSFPGEETGYELIAGTDELGPGATSYTDTDAQRGVDYFYYIQAVGPENTDGSAMTPIGVNLRSSRAFTQTYDPASLKRPPGEEITDFRIVPNPHNINMDSNLRHSVRDQIQFFDIPGECTIRIYTELGELVDTIEHTDGSGDETWSMTSSANQVIVSGVYMVVVEDHNTGDEHMQKFVVIR
jgi:hypothetical protein